MKRRDLSGCSFGRLMVLARIGSRTTACGKRYSLWRCRCACGVEVVALGHDLTRGHKLSCGCLRAENVKVVNLKHGHARGGQQSREYRIWSGMIDRCENPRSTSFARYGGRGVRVCQRWRANFEAFLADVGPRPTPAHSLDRIDGARNYEPGNVRWADSTTQSRNRRGVLAASTVVEIKNCLAAGLSLAAVAERFAISKSQAHRIRTGKSWAACVGPEAMRALRGEAALGGEAA